MTGLASVVWVVPLTGYDSGSLECNFLGVSLTGVSLLFYYDEAILLPEAYYNTKLLFLELVLSVSVILLRIWM